MAKLILNKKIIKYGKKIEDIKNIKKDFLLKNDIFLRNQLLKNKIYKNQPKRKKCKNCEQRLTGEKIKVQNIEYIYCNKCDHLNGIYQDTERFIETIYKTKSINYSKNYFESEKKNYLKRVKNIYKPKAEFLKSNIKNYNKLNILDFGAGSGYFLAALKEVKINNFLGLEISNDQVSYGKNMLKKIHISTEKLKCLSFENSLKLINKSNNFNCITLMGVLEHISQLSKFMKTLKNNKKIKIIYLVVPLFSLTAVIESVFPKIFNRHLGGSHTHLFTENSLKYLFKKNGFHPHSEWWFGQDFNDLARSLEVTSKKFKNIASEKVISQIQNLIDDFQIVLDKKKLSSEVHIIFSRK